MQPWRRMGEQIAVLVHDPNAICAFRSIVITDSGGR
jgi:hypothetical protein